MVRRPLRSVEQSREVVPITAKGLNDMYSAPVPEGNSRTSLTRWPRDETGTKDLYIGGEGARCTLHYIYIIYIYDVI